ncbi:unnamed protein product [Lasius platythorax]|uniref:Uncharacterized protein n=1 Tax=Lasius platythorax TaxID=488582 RepID=A0AAV2NRX1_9HYME
MAFRRLFFLQQYSKIFPIKLPRFSARVDSQQEYDRNWRSRIAERAVHRRDKKHSPVPVEEESREENGPSLTACIKPSRTIRSTIASPTYRTAAFRV